MRCFLQPGTKRLALLDHSPGDGFGLDFVCGGGYRRKRVIPGFPFWLPSFLFFLVLHFPSFLFFPIFSILLRYVFGSTLSQVHFCILNFSSREFQRHVLVVFILLPLKLFFHFIPSMTPLRPPLNTTLSPMNPY